MLSSTMCTVFTPCLSLLYQDLLDLLDYLHDDISASASRLLTSVSPVSAHRCPCFDANRHTISRPSILVQHAFRANRRESETAFTAVRERGGSDGTEVGEEERDKIRSVNANGWG